MSKRKRIEEAFWVHTKSSPISQSHQPECLILGVSSGRNFLGKTTLLPRGVGRQTSTKIVLSLDSVSLCGFSCCRSVIEKIDGKFPIFIYTFPIFFWGEWGSMTFKNKNNYSTDLIQYPLGTPPNSHKCRFIRIS